MPEAAAGLKVCHVFGGTEGGQWVVDQLQVLRDTHGCEVTAVLGGSEGTTPDRCRAAGIRIEPIAFRFGGRGSFWAIPRDFLRLAAWFRRERFDVVQSHGISSAYYARPAAWIADVPVRLAMVTGPLYIRAPMFRWMERATEWMETGIIPSCKETGTLYRLAGIPARAITPTLYYGPPAERFDPATAPRADLRAEFGLPPEARLIGAVALFYPKPDANGFTPAEIHGRHLKGHAELVQAMRIIRAQQPLAYLLLVGGGWGEAGEAAMDEVRQMAADEGVADRVIFTGYRSDIAAVYRDLDVSVQASLNENLGGTVESLLMARPTVATRVGGMVDTVIDGETGVLVAPGDPADLARGILELLADPDRARRLGEAGRERMLAGFTVATTGSGLAALYRRQRDAARGAWRVPVSLARTMIGAMLHVPIFARTWGWELYLKIALPLWWSAAKRRLKLPLRAARRAFRQVRRRFSPALPVEPS